MPGNSKFTLEIENNVLKNLHFKAFKKDTSAFVRKLLSVYRKTLWRLEWNAFTFASERQSDFSGFSFFILPGRPFHSPSPPLQTIVEPMRFSGSKRRLHRRGFLPPDTVSRISQFYPFWQGFLKTANILTKKECHSRSKKDSWKPLREWHSLF